MTPGKTRTTSNPRTPNTLTVLRTTSPAGSVSFRSTGSPANDVARRLSLAACALVGSMPGANVAAERAPTPDWSVDGSYLSYTEADDRVAVSKTLVTLERTLDENKLSVGLVHDTMSGASPTGAIRSSDSSVTYTGSSGGSFDSATGYDGSSSWFEDTRVQAGFSLEQAARRNLLLTWGSVVSSEADYDSFGASVALKRERADKLASFDAGLAATFDTIYRSDSQGTPEPLADTSQSELYGAGKRSTFDALIGATRVLNRRTVAQVNLSLGLSSGYHSDPYKVISAADEEDRVIANYHDSRPGSRLRTSLYGQIVHKLPDSEHSLHLSYRLYGDDWGVLSHTGDFRYRHQLTSRQYLEPHVRLYRQSAADFYARSLGVDERQDAELPDDGFASADYRLDVMSSVTLGLKYGIELTPRTDLRVRAEYLSQSFDTADYGENTALILQTSLKYRF